MSLLLNFPILPTNLHSTVSNKQHREIIGNVGKKTISLEGQGRKQRARKGKEGENRMGHTSNNFTNSIL